MTRTNKPTVYYVVFVVTKFKSFEEAKLTAPADIAAHLARSKELHTAGQLIMAEAFLDKPEEPLNTMAVLISREAAEEYIKGDPFMLKGMVASWYIREWANMLT